jgi:LacI family transcriptional regulator
MFSADSPHVALLIETSLASGRDILRGIARYVRQHGQWSLFHAPGGLADAPPTWLERWKGSGIIARISNAKTAAILRKTKLPVVDVLGMMPGFPLVHVDDAAIARQAFDHFVERGFRHFAFVGARDYLCEPGQDWSERRRVAFCAAADAHDEAAGIFQLTEPSFNEMSWEERQDRLAKWLRQLPKPVGLMVCSDQRGLDVLEACHRADVKVPAEIAVVGVDNDKPLCEVCNPPLSSVLPDHVRVGYDAAALLGQLMAGRRPSGGPQFVLPQTVVTRQSSDVLAVDDPTLSAALRVIRERGCEGISVDEIARAVGLSRSILQRKFRLTFGQTVHDHLIAARLKRALELITNTDMPLVEVAERCGFNNQEYMGVVFRKRLGQTPGQYRNS